MPLVAKRDAEYGWDRIPDGKAAVATTGDPVGLIRMESSLLPVSPLASVTVNVGEKVPSTVGVPVNAPAAEREIPVGRLPALTLQVYGGVPLAAERDDEYGWIRTPDGKAAVETDGDGSGWITMVSDLLSAMPPLSLTVKVGV